MDITVDTTSDLVSGVADVRRVPLGRLAREGEVAVSESLKRVLPDGGRRTVPVAAFNSSI